MVCNPKYAYEDEIRMNKFQMSQMQGQVNNNPQVERDYKKLQDRNNLLESLIKDIERKEKQGIKF